MTVEWDPSLLCADDATARAELAELGSASAEFASRCRGRIADMSAAELAACLAEFGDLHGALARLAAYGVVRTVGDLTDETAADLSAATDDLAAEIGAELSFVVEEWQAVDPARSTALTEAPELVAYRRILLTTHDAREPLGDTEVESGVAVREPAASDAWAALYDLVTGQVRITVDGRDLGIDEALTAGRSSVVALHAALAERSDELAHCLDTLVADRLAVDELRGESHPRAERDRENGIDSAHIDLAMRVVADNRKIAHRWYERKAAALGRPEIDFADVSAPLVSAVEVDFDAATAAVIAAFGRFGLAEPAADVFTEHRVDAVPRPTKLGGSLCVPAGVAPPYVLVNFTGSPADVVTLAHEVGHAVHYLLAARHQGPLGCDPPVLIGEVAASVAELSVLDELVANGIAGMVESRVDWCVSTVFRQHALTRFEDRVYARRAEGEVLTADRLAAEWLGSLREAYGPSVAIGAEYGSGWALVPHFFRTRYYNYSYVLAHLVGQSVHRGLLVDPADTLRRFRDLLACGGADPPVSQLAGIGVDPADPASWQAGLDELTRLVDDAETATHEVFRA